MEIDNDSSHHKDDSEHGSETEVSPVVDSFKGSMVWRYFTKDSNFKESKKATCKYCSKIYVCSGGSTLAVRQI